MTRHYELTVSALVESVLRDECGAPVRGTGKAFASVARFLLGTHGAMTDYLRGPLRFLTLAFALSSIPFTGRWFHQLSHDRRSRRIRAWRRSRIGFKRDLVSFYETLAIFGWYSELYGSDHAPPGDGGRDRDGVP